MTRTVLDLRNIAKDGNGNGNGKYGNQQNYRGQNLRSPTIHFNVPGNVKHVQYQIRSQVKENGQGFLGPTIIIYTVQLRNFNLKVHDIDKANQVDQYER